MRIVPRHHNQVSILTVNLVRVIEHAYRMSDWRLLCHAGRKLSELRENL